jgi:predicted ribosomally synthesized peptide with nif11-like leader
MSVDAARAFVHRMKNDEAFAAKVKAVEDVAARMEVINAEGFDCNAEEIKAVSGGLADTMKMRTFAAGGSWFDCPALRWE